MKIKFPCLINFILLISIYSNTLFANTMLSTGVINQVINILKKSPKVGDLLGPCPNGSTELKDDEIVFEQTIQFKDLPKEVQKTLPGYEFYKPSDLFSFRVAARNDLFVSFITKLRLGFDYVADHGETHGLEFELGKKIKDTNSDFTLIYHTNLFTKSHYSYVDPGVNQTFTSEQLYKILLSNKESMGTWYYDAGIGIVELNTSNDTNVLLASTQQKLLHNNTTYYDVHNSKTPELDQMGPTGNIHVGVQKTFVNKDNSVRLDVNGDIGTELSNVENFNNVQLRLGSDLYFQKTGSKIATKFSFGLPLIFHTARSDGSFSAPYPAIEIRPELEVSIGTKHTEAGFKIELPMGTMRSHVLQNTPTIYDNKVLDQGEMGSIYIKFKF